MTPFDVVAGLLLVLSPAWGDPLAAALPAGTAATASVAAESPAALLDLSDAELRERIEADRSAIGSLSIGAPGSAVLFNAVPLPADPRWTSFAGAQLWATTETIQSIDAAVATVHDLFPETPPIVIGDISDENGGRLKRHESHQGGRDVDFGFYRKGGPVPSFFTGTAANLDLPRNWAFVRALVTRTDVEKIFLDTRIQRLLYATRSTSARTRPGWIGYSCSRADTGTPSSSTCRATATTITCGSTAPSRRSWAGGRIRCSSRWA